MFTVGLGLEGGVRLNAFVISRKNTLWFITETATGISIYTPLSFSFCHISGCSGLDGKAYNCATLRPPQIGVEVRRAASGLASGLALAVRPAGLAEVSGAQGWVLKIVSAKRLETIFRTPLTLEGPARTMRGVPSRL